MLNKLPSLFTFTSGESRHNKLNNTVLLERLYQTLANEAPMPYELISKKYVHTLHLLQSHSPWKITPLTRHNFCINVMNGIHLYGYGYYWLVSPMYIYKIIFILYATVMRNKLSWAPLGICKASYWLRILQSVILIEKSFTGCHLCTDPLKSCNCQLHDCRNLYPV